MPTRRSAPRATRQPIDLALQGGGSHGAFTWGVLDRLLEEPRIEIAALSGTSAGALNAAVLASGFAAGGREGARQALRAFWHDVGGVRGCFGEEPARPASPAWPWPPLPAGLGGLAAPWFATPGLEAFNLDRHPAYAWWRLLTGIASPYQLNPLGINPLRAVAQRHVDEDALRRGPLQLFVTATAVRTGRPRLFTGSELSLDALLASACLPQLFRAVEIGGEPFWDGGYSGNPALWPLIYHAVPSDIMLVKINPLLREGVPDTAAEIADRVNEITFNASLIGEMRAIDFVQRLLDEGRVDPGRYRSLRLHMIADDERLAPLSASSKLNTDLRFLLQLHGIGREAAHRWLRRHRSDVGRRPTLDIAAAFLSGR